MGQEFDNNPSLQACYHAAEFSKYMEEAKKVCTTEESKLMFKALSELALVQAIALKEVQRLSNLLEKRYNIT